MFRVFQHRMWLSASLGFATLLAGLSLSSARRVPEQPGDKAPAATSSIVTDRSTQPPLALVTELPGWSVQGGILQARTTSRPSPSPSPAVSPRPEKPAATSANRPASQAVSAPPLHALTIDSALEMQVAIREGANSVTIGTSTAAKVLDTEGRVLQQIPPQQAYVVEPNGQGLSMGSWQLPTAVWIQPGPDGLIYLDNRFYRGRMLVVTNGNSILVVNHVLLKDYLYSVVGSEVPASWPQDALKAQAVAARSYALTYYFKPANSLYHLGDTQAYQVYSGVEKETNTTRAAVDSTAGEFLSYQGGIVESLYAASDELVATAHGGRGMSQTGAMQMAEQGHNYLQILGNYYPGTAVARIQLDHE